MKNPAPAPGGSEPRSEKAWALCLLLTYLALVAGKLALAVGLDTPLVPDEVVYLGNARYLATGEGLVDDTGRHAYKIGYSLLLVPAFWFGNDSVEGFKAAQTINAFLLSLVFPAAYLLARRLNPRLAAVDRWLVALCVSVYPAAVVYSTTAMSINAFLPAFFVFVLAGLEASSRRRWWGWALFAGATVFLYSIHEKAIGIVVVATLMAAFHLLRPSAGPTRSMAFFLAAPAAVGAMRLLEVPGSRWHTRSQSLAVIQGVLAEPGKLLVTVAGHLEYLGLATFGVLVVGTLFALLRLRRARARDGGSPLDLGVEAPWTFWWLLYGAVGSVFAISVLFNVVRWPEVRFTQWVYGRHNENVVLPLVVFALLLLRQAQEGEHRRELRLAGLGTLALFAALAGILWWHWTPSVGPAYNLSATGISIFSALLQAFGWVLAPVVVLLVLVGLAVLFAVRWRWGVMALTVCFAASTSATYEDRWRERYAEKEQQRQLVQLVRRIEEVREPAARTILRHRDGKLFHFHYYNTSYFLPEYTFRGYRPGKKRPPGELVLSGGLRFGEKHPGARLVGLESYLFDTGYLQSLWVLPGELRQALQEKRWLMPAGFPRRLSRGYLRSRLRIVEEERWMEPVDPARPGRRPVALEHLGKGPWPHRSGLRTAEHSVGLRARWSPRGRPTEILAERVIRLPHMLYPGDETEISVPLGTRPALPPGRYDLRLQVIQELPDEAWVESRAFLDLEVEIAAAAADRGEEAP